MSDDDVRAWLRERGAERIPHPGGTLYAHLGGVHDRLDGPDLRRAGLTHAAYGTDGFDVTLLDHATGRDELRRLVGAVETLTPPELRPFVDLSIVNELDVLEHDPTVGPRYGDYFRRVFTAWAGLASPAVNAAVRRALP